MRPEFLVTGTSVPLPYPNEKKVGPKKKSCGKKKTVVPKKKVVPKKVVVPGNYSHPKRNWSREKETRLENLGGTNWAPY